MTVPVTITNTGAAAATYFTDARLDQVGTLALANIGSSDTFALPQPAGVMPEWLLPTHSSQFSVTAQGSDDANKAVPVNLDVFWSAETRTTTRPHRPPARRR